MGLQIGEIVPRRETSFEELRGKIIAVDAFNTIYQFLTTIRQPDGTPLMDSKGKITSHFSGLFYRNIHLLNHGIKLVYVFDGTPPKLKEKTAERREESKKEALAKYREAKKMKNIEEMAKYARSLARLDEEIVKESKQILSAIGIPYIQAPSEGEAQAAFMCKAGDVNAVASQDYDALLYGSPRLLQNLTLAKKRRLPSGVFVQIRPELIELQKVLNTLQINYEQLLCLGILVGTDYNPGGVRGIGPKKALLFVRQYKKPILIFRAAEKISFLDFDWQEIFELFKKPEITTKYKIKFEKPKEKEIKNILCKQHNFSEERIENALKKLEEEQKKASQTALKKFF